MNYMQKVVYWLSSLCGMDLAFKYKEKRTKMHVLTVSNTNMGLVSFCFSRRTTCLPEKKWLQIII
jgi:hypothetical protein